MRWLRCAISSAPVEIIDGDRGKEYPKQTDFQESGYCLFLNTGNVRQDGFDFSNCQFVSEGKDRRLRKGKLTREDLVMTTRGTIGNVAYFDENVPYEQIRINSGMVVFRTDRTRLLPAFLYHFFRSSDFVGQTNSLKSGAAQPQLPIRDIKQIEIPLPNIPTQQRITSILSTYDDLIENNRRRMALLEDAARQVYQEWFVRLRFPGREHTRIVEGVPEGWRKVTLGSITTKIGSGFTPRGGDASYSTEGITLIRSLNVYNDQFEENGLAFINEDQAAGLANVTVLSRDILLNITGASVTRCCMAPERYLPARVNQHVMIIRCNPTFADPFFAHAAINSDERKRQLISFAQKGSTREALTKEMVTNFDIVLPTDQIMRQYGEFAEVAFMQRENLAFQNQKLRAARDLLLPKLMSGEIAV